MVSNWINWFEHCGYFCKHLMLNLGARGDSVTTPTPDPHSDSKLAHVGGRLEGVFSRLSLPKLNLYCTLHIY